MSEGSLLIYLRYGIHIRDLSVDLSGVAELGYRITSLEVGRCGGVLNRRHHTDGPFRSTHGVAITLFAETLAGLAVFTRLGPKGKGILIKSETEYIRKVKGIFTVEGTKVGSVIGMAAFDPEERTHKIDTVNCEVMLHDILGETVAKVFFGCTRD